MCTSMLSFSLPNIKHSIPQIFFFSIKIPTVSTTFGRKEYIRFMFNRCKYKPPQFFLRVHLIPLRCCCDRRGARRSWSSTASFQSPPSNLKGFGPHIGSLVTSVEAFVVPHTPISCTEHVGERSTRSEGSEGVPEGDSTLTRYLATMCRA